MPATVVGIVLVAVRFGVVVLLSGILLWLFKHWFFAFKFTTSDVNTSAPSADVVS